jgi:hypothetical protein
VFWHVSGGCRSDTVRTATVPMLTERRAAVQLSGPCRRTAKSGDWPVFRLKEVRYAGNRWPKTRACPLSLRLCISPGRCATGAWSGDQGRENPPFRRPAGSTRPHTEFADYNDCRTVAIRGAKGATCFRQLTRRQSHFRRTKIGTVPRLFMRRSLAAIKPNFRVTHRHALPQPPHLLLQPL